MTLPTNLDQFEPSTRFVGRQAEISQSTQTLLDPGCQLLTLVGVGGVGKTRLAIQLAKQHHDIFEQGAWFVNLQSLNSEDQIAATVMDAIGIAASGHETPETQLLQYLQEKSILLILDNFEHLLDGVGLLESIIQQAPEVKIIVTSREALRLPGEWLLAVKGLTIPKSYQTDDLETNSAVELFIDRAQQVQPDISLEEERASIVRLCQLVEGLPLAIELSASWAKTLRCSEITAEIQRNLNFLTTRLRHVPERHRSMQAVFDQTWALLTENEKSLFRRLAVFRGGFQREAAGSITDASLQVLSALLDKSLLRRDRRGRFRIHELLRQFAEDKLDASEMEALKEAHCQYYCEFLAERTLGTVEDHQVETIEEIEFELENIRIAWQYAIVHKRIDPLCKATPSYFYFCQIQSRYLESSEALALALEVFTEAENDKWVAQTLVYQGWMLIRIGRFEQAFFGLKQSLATFQEQGFVPEYGMGSHPIAPLVILNILQGDYPRAIELGEQLKSKSVAAQDLHNLSFACYGLVGAYLSMGQLDMALHNGKQALHSAKEVGNHWFTSYCQIELGNVHQALENYSEAERHFRAALHVKMAYKDPEGIAVTAKHLGDLSLLQEDLEAAQDFFERSLASYQDLNDRGGLAAAHHGLGQVAIQKDNFDLASRHLKRSLEIAANINFLPLLLSLLIDIGILFQENVQRQRGEELLRLVHDHPASNPQQQKIVRSRFGEFMEMDEEPLPDFQATISSLPSELLDFQTKELTVDESPLIDPLTPREEDVLSLLCQGLTNPAIAEELIISEGTVKAHTHRIYGKLGVSNRVEAVTKARDLSLLE